MLHRPLYRFLGRFLKRNDRRNLASKIILEDCFDYSIRNADFVNSRSILFSCSIYPDNPQSSFSNTDYLDSIPERLSAFQNSNASNDIPIIYVVSDGIPYFIKDVLEKIEVSYILVTGDSDVPINSMSLGANLETLLNSPKLIRWFCQNRDTNHPKIFSLPIGINIHNLWSNPLEWGGGFILPAMQELELRTISQEAKPLRMREKKIFCNWHFSIDRADRRECFQKIDHHLCHFQEKPLPMATTWKLQSQFQYVLSPHGAGLDCHRTWEALILGCIPIIKSSTIDDLFHDLPVIIVNDWSEIRPGFLENETAKLLNKNINTQKLYMRYWKSQFRTAANMTQ